MATGRATVRSCAVPPSGNLFGLPGLLDEARAVRAPVTRPVAEPLERLATPSMRRPMLAPVGRGAA